MNFILWIIDWAGGEYQWGGTNFHNVTVMSNVVFHTLIAESTLKFENHFSKNNSSVNDHNKSVQTILCLINLGVDGNEK